MTLAALSPAPGNAFPGKRYFSRARLNLPARLVTFNGTSACTLIDLSRSGAKLGGNECPRVGAMVVVEGLPIELFGMVRWSAKGLFGFEFEAPLPLERVIAMRYYADDEAARQNAAQLAYARNWVQGVI
jgi:hypothetical protein